ncbi:hypothetical protein SF83666_b64170 (plasmid) [Sinorhizobium fredii CCBAU 83666]|nr:hypothetical protein SF83666_b64170 [Sinorhizobium fredii CCBAU 83666]
MRCRCASTVAAAAETLASARDRAASLSSTWAWLMVLLRISSRRRS